MWPVFQIYCLPRIVLKARCSCCIWPCTYKLWLCSLHVILQFDLCDWLFQQIFAMVVISQPEGPSDMWRRRSADEVSTSVQQRGLVSSQQPRCGVHSALYGTDGCWPASVQKKAHTDVSYETVTFCKVSHAMFSHTSCRPALPEHDAACNSA